MKHFDLILTLVVTCVIIQSAQGFNLFEFLQRKFSNVRPAYQPPPPQLQRVQHDRRPAPRWPPPPQQPQLQYNYDTPLDNVIEQPTRAPSPPPPRSPPQPPRYSYSRPTYESYEPEQPVAHYEAYEPEQPADVPVVVGTYNLPGFDTLKTTTTTPRPPPTQSSYYREYEEIDIITAPPIGGHRHYGNTYEVQVGTNFNAGTK